MKAQEYFNKYGPGILTNDKELSQKAGKALIHAMVVETLEIATTKHAESDDQMQEVVNRQNWKWNRIVDLFMKKFGVSPLHVDGFREHIRKLWTEEKMEEDVACETVASQPSERQPS